MEIETGICAWCLEEKGEQAKPNQSHTICKRHSDEMIVELNKTLPK